MSALVLKVIACIAMLIDHSAVYMYYAGLFMGGRRILYIILRSIGRIAFPIFAYQLAVGASKTRNKKKYLIRMLIFSAVSEIPFNLLASLRFFTWEYQNVFFTLTLGLICIYLIQWAGEQEGNRVKYALHAVVGCGLIGVLAELLHTDYGLSGIVLISLMGLLTQPLTSLRMKFASDVKVRLFIVTIAISACCLIAGGLEWFALFALIPIGFYNGTQGKTSKALRIGFYVFYPAHLTILAILFLGPYMFG